MSDFNPFDELQLLQVFGQVASPNAQYQAMKAAALLGGGDVMTAPYIPPSMPYQQGMAPLPQVQATSMPTGLAPFAPYTGLGANGGMYEQFAPQTAMPSQLASQQAFDVRDTISQVRGGGATKGNDAWEKIKSGALLQEPWFRFGLGMLAGNRGKTRGAAFNNALAGGQQAISQYNDDVYNRMVADAQTRNANLKVYEHQMHMDKLAGITSMAKERLAANPNDQEARFILMDPENYLKIMETGSKAADREADNLRQDRRNAVLASAVGGGAGGRTSAEYNTYLALRARGEIPADMTYINFLGTVAGEKRASPSVTVVPKHMQKNYEDMMDNDPTLAVPRGDGVFNWEKSEYTDARKLLPQTAHMLQRKYGLTTDVAYKGARDIHLNGMTEEQLFGPGSSKPSTPSKAQAKPLENVTQAEIAATARKYGVSEAEVKKRLGLQ